MSTLAGRGDDRRLTRTPSEKRRKNVVGSRYCDIQEPISEDLLMNTGEGIVLPFLNGKAVRGLLGQSFIALGRITR